MIESRPIRVRVDLVNVLFTAVDKKSRMVLDLTKDDVAFLGTDPGSDIDEAWWDEMLVQWFDVPEEELDGLFNW